jgi:hypothetical protein
VIAVGRSDEPPAALGLQVAFLHQPADLPGIDDHAEMAQLRPDPTIAIGLELSADRIMAATIVALARAWSVSPAMNSWATCRLNSLLWERCLAMAFIL